MFMTAVSLGLTCTAFADNYSDLAAQGYRWVTVDGLPITNKHFDITFNNES